MQRMTAGRGIRHSEFNPSKTEPVHFLQIWIIPHTLDLEPEYEQKAFAPLLKSNQRVLLISPKQEEAPLFIHQNAWISMAKMEKGGVLNDSLLSLKNGMYGFLVSGKVKIDGTSFKPGDAVGIIQERTFSVTAEEESQILFLEVPFP